MKYQICFSKAVMQSLVRKPGYAASCGASKSIGKLMYPSIHHPPTTYTNHHRCYNHLKSYHLATPTSVGSPSREKTYSLRPLCSRGHDVLETAVIL